ncbi:MAG: adenylyl-sulfate kinase [Candidatus Omnitrophica bacterium]|nr:adenylyl-sulfate kinase [Candidatus Omnitrophota bacterium]
MVIWLIGLSKSGKTTLTRLLYDRLKPMIPNLVRLDGDLIRELFGHDVDHTVGGRRKNAERLSHLSKFLSDQNIHVIAAVLSIFPEWRRWNRANIPGYAEVYLKTSLETVKRRDSDNLYIHALQGKIKNVVGVDIPFPEPEGSDLIIDNDAQRDDFEELISQIVSLPVIQKMIEGNR